MGKVKNNAAKLVDSSYKALVQKNYAHIPYSLVYFILTFLFRLRIHIYPDRICLWEYLYANK